MLEVTGAPQVAQWSRTRLPKQEMQEMQVCSLGQEDPLEEGMATHSSILTWRIPWTEEPGSLWSIGSQNLARIHAQLVFSVIMLFWFFEIENSHLF